MKSEKEIKEMLESIESDERLYYPCAIVETNAPLALIQVMLETSSKYLRWVLNMPGLDISAERIKRK